MVEQQTTNMGAAQNPHQMMRANKADKSEGAGARVSGGGARDGSDCDLDLSVLIGSERLNWI